MIWPLVEHPGDFVYIIFTSKASTEYFVYIISNEKASMVRLFTYHPLEGHPESMLSTLYLLKMYLEGIVIMIYLQKRRKKNFV